VHVDEIYAKSVGMPSVYAPGMLVMGMLGQLVSDWGRGGQLRRYNVRFIKMVWPADTVVCKGRVTDRHGQAGRYFAEIDLWAENQRGELVMKGAAQLQLFYSLEDENRQRSGQPPLVVDVPRESLRAPAAAESGASMPETRGEETGAKKAPASAAAKKSSPPREKPAPAATAAAGAKKPKK
jgi:hypothetical protein